MRGQNDLNLIILIQPLDGIFSKKTWNVYKSSVKPYISERKIEMHVIFEDYVKRFLKLEELKKSELLYK